MITLIGGDNRGFNFSVLRNKDEQLKEQECKRAIIAAAIARAQQKK